jgi:hypothetical protein
MVRGKDTTVVDIRAPHMPVANLCQVKTLTLTDVEDRLCMIESLAIQPSQPSSTLGPGGTGQPAKPVKCHNCERLGHIASVCGTVVQRRDKHRFNKGIKHDNFPIRG